MTDPNRTRILVVISEPLLAQLVSFRLELLGYEVTVCGTAAQGIDHLQSQLIDLILVDTQVPDADGLEHLRRLSTTDAEQTLPMIVVSLDPSLETVERAYLRGATDYLITPFDPTVLEEKVHRAIAGPFTATLVH